MPSLAQLNEAVTSYIAEHPGVLVTVVVDATFGHRIDADGGHGVRRRGRQQRARRSAGRCDRPRRRVRAEHRQQGQGDDPLERLVPGVPRRATTWLFDEGRLDRRQAGAARRLGLRRARSPVRGPISRKSVRASKPPSGRNAAADGGSTKTDREPTTRRGSARRASKEAAAPMPVPTMPPPGRATPRPSTVASLAAAPSAPSGDVGERPAAVPRLRASTTRWARASTPSSTATRRTVRT